MLNSDNKMLENQLFFGPSPSALSSCLSSLNKPAASLILLNSMQNA